MKEGETMNFEETQEIHVRAVCRTAQEAEALATKHQQLDGVIGVKVVDNILIFICRVAKRSALVVYGRIKDILPHYCRCSCRPVPA